MAKKKKNYMFQKHKTNSLLIELHDHYNRSGIFQVKESTRWETNERDVIYSGVCNDGKISYFEISNSRKVQQEKMKLVMEARKKEIYK